MGTLILCSLLSVLIATLVVYFPLLVHPERPYFEVSPEAHRFDEKLSLLEVLSELENDFNSGRLTEPEYAQISLETKRAYLKLKHNEDN